MRSYFIGTLHQSGDKDISVSLLNYVDISITNYKACDI